MLECAALKAPPPPRPLVRKSQPAYGIKKRLARRRLKLTGTRTGGGVAVQGFRGCVLWCAWCPRIYLLETVSWTPAACRRRTRTLPKAVAGVRKPGPTARAGSVSRWVARAMPASAMDSAVNPYPSPPRMVANTCMQRATHTRDTHTHVSPTRVTHTCHPQCHTHTYHAQARVTAAACPAT
jgi:hypothetical protein